MQKQYNSEAIEECSSGDLYMIEEIDSESNKVVLSNYLFNKKRTVILADKQIEMYAMAFDSAIEKNMYLFVEFNEREGVIIG